VQSAAEDELVNLPFPVLEGPVLQRWRAAVEALRRLAEPLPWFVEAALDTVLTRLEAWLAIADENRQDRELLLERIRGAMRDEDEEQLARVLHEAGGPAPGQPAHGEGAAASDGRTPHYDLLDAPVLRKISNFWMRRLRFDQNGLLPRHARTSAWSYYGPLLLAIFGAPLTTVQTDMVWVPLIGDPREGAVGSIGVRFWFVNLLFLAVCLYGLWSDLRRRLRGLDRPAVLRRSSMPLLVLFGINYALALVLQVITAERLETLSTVMMWGTLSLYLGLFLGLLAQGNRIDSEDVGKE
jgi:hypothetical protein